MKVFVTGASGFIGQAVLKELMAAGHAVVGLARSDAAATTVSALGATVLRGDLKDTDVLKKGAVESDGVIHLGFIHDFANFVGSCAVDKTAIDAIGEALEGTNKPFITTSGLLGVIPPSPGSPRTETSVHFGGSPRQSESVLDFAARGVRAVTVRLPPSVHGAGDHGFVPSLIHLAKTHGTAAFPGDGLNKWSAVHRADAASLYRLALEQAPAGTVLHGIAEAGVPTKDIASVIGRRLGLPVVSKGGDDATAYFGWMARFVAMDAEASSAATQSLLGWCPSGPGLLEDMAAHYF